ncbi:hypothetical protein D3C71_2165380 [compost metagenome]
MAVCSTNSAAVFTPAFCDATSTMGWEPTRPMGVKSSIVYFTALLIRRAMAISLFAPTMMV